VGLRRGRTAVVGAIAAGAVMAFAASPAQATLQPFNATFDDAALSVGGLAFDILEPPDHATLTGTREDGGSGAFNVPDSGFVFPPFSGDPIPGIHVDAQLTALEPITGTLDPSGNVNTDPSSFRADVRVNGGATCPYTADLAFTTNDTAGAPFPGDPFDFAAGPPATITNGDMQSSWPAGHFPPAGGDCNLVDMLVTDDGGLAIGQNVDLTPAQAGSGGGGMITTPPVDRPARPKKCKKRAKKIKDRVKRKKALKKCKKKFG
jgi:hypothetical protein